MATKTNKKANVPNLRFSGFQDEWENKRLGDIIEFKAGYAFPSNGMLNEKSTYQLIKMSNVYRNELRLDRNPSFWPEVDAKQREFILKKGDTVLTLTGTVGKKDFGYSVQITEGDKYLLNQRLVLLREKKNKSANDFINQLVSNEKFLGDFFETAKGGTGNQTNVGIEDVKNLTFFFPSDTEQRKIAAFLSVIDKRIQTQNKIIEKLETLIKGISEKLFGQSVRFKDNDELDFPKWKIKKLGEVLTIGNGKDYKHLDVGSIPVFGTGGLMTHVNSFLYEGETVCIGRKGTIDKPMYYKGKIWTVDTLFYTHSFLDVLPKFMFYVFKAINWKEHNEASGVPSLSKSTIEKIAIKIPCVPEQRRIAELLSAIEKKMGIERILLTSYQKQKEFLLDQLFI